MSVYLDASVVVAFITDDPFSTRADRLISSHADEMIVSDFVAAEFASAIARQVRTRAIGADAAQTYFSTFDAWRSKAGFVATTTDDVAQAARYIRTLNVNLRTPDALNLALAQRAGADLATFDEGMAAAAQALRIPLTAV